MTVSRWLLPRGDEALKAYEVAPCGAAAARAQPFRFVGVAGTDPCASVVPFGSSFISWRQLSRQLGKTH